MVHFILSHLLLVVLAALVVGARWITYAVRVLALAGLVGGGIVALLQWAYGT